MSLDLTLLDGLFMVGAAAATLLVLANLAGVWAILKTRMLEDEPEPGAEPWPRLSVVLAACNEEATLEPALRTLLTASYPALEIVVVNDRSTDTTGAILDRLAAEDDRIVAVHLESLPDGWLGKVHALERGTEIASGELLLFTDADIHFSPGSLERAVAKLERERLDHLSLLPNLIGGSLLLQATISAVAGALVLGAETILRWHPRMALGVGAFNLVRRDALAHAGGFAPLKMEVVDDSGLACLIQRTGGRCDWIAAPTAISLTWYPTVGEMMRGLEKNLFGLMAAWSGWRAAAVTLAMATFSIGPWLTLLPGPLEHGWIFGLAAYLSLIGPVTLLKVRFGFPVLPSLLNPIGQLLILFFFLRSSVLCLLRRGIVWRGTHYPLAQLRAGQYVKLV
jgi:glycosyltransferase involved in cell wall biosynthesis